VTRSLLLRGALVIPIALNGTKEVAAWFMKAERPSFGKALTFRGLNKFKAPK